MRLPKFRFAVLTGVVLGVMVPLLYFTSHKFQEYIASGRGGFLWPSGIWLMATDGHEYEASAYALIAISIVANVLLYAIALSLIWCVGWVLRTWRGSLRDGTTI